MSTLLLATVFTFGQQTQGTLEGTIKDSKGAVVPGASVTVTGVTTAFNQTVTSNDSGLYRIERAPAGRYKVKVAAISGFAETTVDAQVVIEKTTTADITLGISTADINVEVGADPLGVVVDTSDSKVQTNITSELIDKLPSGTSFTSVLKVSPGTRGEALTGGFQVDGASKAENSFVLDGQEVTNYRYGTLSGINNVPTALVKEVQVKNSGFEAEHGGASGGVVSVVTKSGTDQFHGEFGAQIETSRFQPNNRFVTQNYAPNDDASYQRWYAIQQPKDDYTQFDPTASLGGPIMKEHLWFYGIYSPQVFTGSRTTNFFLPFDPATGPVLIPNTAYGPDTFHVKTKYEYAQGRLDYTFFNNLNGFTSYLWNPLSVEGIYPHSAISVGGAPISQIGYTETGSDLARLKGGRENSNVFTTQLTWTPLSTLAVTGRYGHGFVNSKTASYALFTGLNRTCQGNSGAAYTSGAAGCVRGYWDSPTGNGGSEYEVSKRHTANFDATRSTALEGTHLRAVMSSPNSTRRSAVRRRRLA